MLKHFVTALTGFSLAACGSLSGTDETQSTVIDENEARTPPASTGSATESYAELQKFNPSDDEIDALTRLLAPDYADHRERPSFDRWPPSFRAAAFDLTGDGENELLVWLESRCGSGGCVFRVYQKTESGLERISGSTLTFLPIGVAEESNLGWRDIVVSVRGDYVEGGMARLRYSDGIYPLNATMPPGAPTISIGQVVLSDASPVYPLTD